MYSIGTLAVLLEGRFSMTIIYDISRTSKRRLTLPGVVDKEEGDGVSDASRNWAKDGVGRPHWGPRGI